MSTEQDRLWSAYLDGELTAAEANDFEKSLSDAERDRLSAEMRLENRLAEVVGAEVKCPESLWRGVEQQLAELKTPLFKRKISWQKSLGAIAAACLLIVGAYAAYELGDWRNGEPAFLKLAEASVDDLEHGADLLTDDAARVEDFLRRNGLDVSLAPESQWSSITHHHIEIVGVRRIEYKGDEAFEVLFACCGEPVKIVLARRSTAPAMAIANSLGHCSGDSTSRSIDDNYLCLTVGNHQAEDLVMLFK